MPLYGKYLYIVNVKHIHVDCLKNCHTNIVMAKPMWASPTNMIKNPKAMPSSTLAENNVPANINQSTPIK